MDAKTLYSKKAEKYARFRWDYAAEAIDTIINLTEISLRSSVADIGAGSGILTRHFIGKARSIYAIEPDAEFRKILTRDLGSFPSIAVIDGSAEDTTLPDDSIDVITAAQAVHWFDPEPARQEMLRILKNQGWLVLLRNYGTNQARNEAVGSLMIEEYGADYSSVKKNSNEKPASFYFGSGDFRKLVFPFEFCQNWDEFIGSLTTASFMPDEDHPLFGKLETKAREVFSRFSDQGILKVQGETELIIGQPVKITR